MPAHGDAKRRQMRYVRDAVTIFRSLAAIGMIYVLHDLRGRCTKRARAAGRVERQSAHSVRSTAASLLQPTRPKWISPLSPLGELRVLRNCLSRRRELRNPLWRSRRAFATVSRLTGFASSRLFDAADLLF